jgi:2-phospho-L-lactate guanylyltransferase
MLALVPVKSFRTAKQRLSQSLTQAGRAELSRAMLTDVLSVLTSQREITSVVICTADPDISDLARVFGARQMTEAELGCHGLNPVINAAANLLSREDVHEMLVVHGDLPLLNHDELTQMIETHRHKSGASITLAPDRRRDGTNLLMWNPASGFLSHYGPASFARHCAQAKALHMRANICILQGGALDIDEPEDLLLLSAMPGLARAKATAAFLHENAAIGSAWRNAQTASTAKAERL